MRIGLGGSLFGIRGGVSNRGFGLGIGPVSVGSSWRRRGRRSSGDSFIGFVFVVGLLLAVLAWPWWLGTWLAVQLGADNPSPVRSVVGWLFELPWLAFLLVAVVSWMRQSSRQAAALAEFHAVRPVVGPGGRTVYHHGACTINHRTFDAAQRCRSG